MKIKVMEYRHHSLCCSACGAVTPAHWPADVARTSFGRRAQVVVGYLTGRLGAGHHDVVEAMVVLYGLRLSAGCVSAIQRQVSAALGAPVEQARRFVCRKKAIC